MLVPLFLPQNPFLWPVYRNDLRKVLDESEDNFGDVETTKSTTTTTSTLPPTTSTTTVSTTKSTSTQRSTKRYYTPSKSPDVPKTPKTYFSNSFYNNNNHNNINGQSDLSKSPFKGVTEKILGDTETPKPAFVKPTINPFYYGFNRLPQYNTTTTQRSPRLFTTTNRTPYSFQYFTTTKKLDLLTASTTQANYEVDNNYYENQSPPSDIVETEKPKSSTYNPVFDIYFKQIGRQRTTTKRT